MCDCVEGQENMAGRGQKASCARSHGCIKQGMKYAIMEVHSFQRKLLIQCTHREKFLMVFYSNNACRLASFSQSASAAHPRTTRK